LIEHLALALFTARAAAQITHFRAVCACAGDANIIIFQDAGIKLSMLHIISLKGPPHQAVERAPLQEREFFIDSLLARIHFTIVMIRWTGLAPCEFEYPFTSSLPFTFLVRRCQMTRFRAVCACAGDANRKK
jgi:hypothetical protein